MGEKMIILDTSFLISFYNSRDNNHNKSWKVMEELIAEKHGEICITDYIFDECATVLFSRLKDLEKAVMICESIKKVKCFKIEDTLFEEAWQIFKNQKNSKFSFTDCTILSLMKEMKINSIATFDKEFEKIASISVRGN